MLKRLPSKNQRSKGVRVKHVLQICLLIGVCFWLVYQIKHSREKKKEFDENGSKISNENKAENIRLGRKDLPLEEPVRNERPDDEEREEVEEEDETKNDQSENDNEIEENDDDDRMEKKDEDFVEENGGGDVDDQIETVDSSDEDRDPDQDRDQIGDHEAREEHYRGDDASSEVTHEGEEEEEQLEEEAPDGTIDDNTLDGAETDDESPAKNFDDDDDGITMVSRSKKVRHSALSTKQPNDHEGTENNNNIVQVNTESTNSSFEKGIEISDSSQLKSTEESVSEPGQTQNGTNSVGPENIRVEHNSTVSSETDYKDKLSKDNGGSNGTVQTEEREGLSKKLEETVDPTRHDPIDSTDTQIGQEMNEAQTDLETLPDLTTSQGNNNDNEEIAAE